MQIVTIFLLILSVTLSYGDKENCDFMGNLIYEDLGCKPVTKEGRDCPVKYNCNFEVKNKTCTFRGNSIPVSETLTDDDTYAACYVGCRCRFTNKFECAILDCPEWLGSPVKLGCYRKYELGKCCSVGQICPTESTPPAECKIDGALSVEGERYYPKDTCLVCVCDKGYEGKNEPPFCSRQMCAAEVRNSENIHSYCAPNYGGSDEKVLCCPDGWVCPSNNDKTLPPNPKRDTTSDLTCRYGDKTLKLGERIQGEYQWYDGSMKESQCECILPPLLTCRDIPRPPLTSTSPSLKIEKISV